MSIASTQLERTPARGGFDPSLTGAVRRLKTGDLLARRLVRAYQGLPEGITHHMEMLYTLKKAFPKLGLTQKALHLYDYLFCLTGPQDWHRDRLALVWPSNDRLVADLGICDVSFLKKLFRQLRGLGLIDYKDSPTRRRYGRRLPDGTIDYPNSFGIVLNSIAGRHADFKALAEAALVERHYRKAVQRALSGARRERDDLLCVAEEVMERESFLARLAVFDGLDAEIATSGRDYGRKEALVARYRTALDTLIAELASDAQAPDVDPSVPDASELTRMASYVQDLPRAGGKQSPSIRNITAPLPSSGNRLSDKSSGREGGDSRQISDLGRQSGEVDGTGKARNTGHPGGAATHAGDGVAKRPQSNQEAIARKLAAIRERGAAEAGPATHHWEPAKVSLRQVRAALPSSTAVHIRDDWGFFEVYDHLRDAAAADGLSPLVVDEARLLMGRELACACMAVILAKRGQLRSADNYLRGLMSKYRDRALRIERSLFGIIAERRKRRPETRKLPL